MERVGDQRLGMEEVATSTFGHGHYEVDIETYARYSYACILFVGRCQVGIVVVVRMRVTSMQSVVIQGCHGGQQRAFTKTTARCQYAQVTCSIQTGGFEDKGHVLW